MKTRLELVKRIYQYHTGFDLSLKDLAKRVIDYAGIELSLMKFTPADIILTFEDKFPQDPSRFYFMYDGVVYTLLCFHCPEDDAFSAEDLATYMYSMFLANKMFKKVTAYTSWAELFPTMLKAYNFIRPYLPMQEAIEVFYYCFFNADFEKEWDELDPYDHRPAEKMLKSKP